MSTEQGPTAATPAAPSGSSGPARPVGLVDELLIPRIGWGRRIVSWLLLAVAGATDAIGFLLFAGVYVSFVTGAATQAGLQFGHWRLEGALAVIAAQLLFILGAALGQAVRVTLRRRPRTVVLVGVTALLVAAALTGLAGGAGTGVTGIRLASCVCAIVAMGAMNAVMHQEAGVPVGTMVTGTLIRLGQGIVERMRGHRAGVTDNLGQWVFFMGGAAVGAVAYAGMGALAFLAPAAVTLAMAVVILRRRVP